VNKLFRHFTIQDMFLKRLQRSVAAGLSCTTRVNGFWCRVADQQSLLLNATIVEASQQARHRRICYSTLDWTIFLTWGHWSSSSRATHPPGMKFLIASGENQLLDQFCTPQSNQSSKTYIRLFQWTTEILFSRSFKQNIVSRSLKQN
jgi:hypothetical protein